MLRKPLYPAALIIGLILMLGAAGPSAGQKKALTYQDIMKFKQIRSPVISEDGRWAAYAAVPDRGDGLVIVRALEGDREYRIERGERPVIAKSGAWAAAAVKPEAVLLAKSKKKKPQPGMALVNLGTGEIKRFEKVKSFAFSDDSRWLAYLLHKADKTPEPKPESQPEEKPSEEKAEKAAKLETGSILVLVNLESGEEIQIPSVLEFEFDHASRFLGYAMADDEAGENGIYAIELGGADWARKTVYQRSQSLCSHLVWSKTRSRLAFLVAESSAETKADRDTTLWIWDGRSDRLTEAVAAGDIPSGWMLPEKNALRWSKDAARLFFGFKPESFRQKEEPKAEEGEIDLFDVGKLQDDAGVDVWHWNDPFINPHQKKQWPRLKDQTYVAVYHVDSRKAVRLADTSMPVIRISDTASHVLGTSDVPYRKEMTWYGRLFDLYVVDLKSGERRRVAARLEDRYSISPGGRYVVFYHDRHWHIFDRRGRGTRPLTANLDTPFYNEDHDYPSSVPGYGTAGWLENDQAVLIYDKYDIWKFPVRGGTPVNITAGMGRRDGTTFRVIRTDPEEDAYAADRTLLLSAYNHRRKNWGFYAGTADGAGPRPLVEEDRKFTFLAKAKRADRILYTREAYDEFPDLWASGPDFATPRRVSHVNPQIEDFAWGGAELVEWDSTDGIPLQGVLIKPGNYEEGTRYPVLVYYYRFFSQRLHEFNQVVINHRPCFPFYASNGYAVFLPDIRFDIGLPGPAAVECLVPGVQKIIDMGVADPDAIALHGHSWSGYQTAFVITRTDIFKCAVAGAPVSNMTSAYSGIRWGTGLARQFQYEKSQSRIGGSLWEKRDLYIENSPVFFADRIRTPLLIIFGDVDGAVPWYQGIELYLAMRRLGKDCVFLQYRDEPHHPQKYPNKLDWFKKMKEYFDHYLKGTPGPDWITKGVPYNGK